MFISNIEDIEKARRLIGFLASLLVIPGLAAIMALSIFQEEKQRKEAF